MSDASTTLEDHTEPELVVDDSDELTAEDLIEEVSIDGMCGVY